MSQAPVPLKGLRVLDFTRVPAGPVTGRLLAEMGAEEIRKIGVSATSDWPSCYRR